MAYDLNTKYNVQYAMHVPSSPCNVSQKKRKKEITSSHMFIQIDDKRSTHEKKKTNEKQINKKLFLYNS